MPRQMADPHEEFHEPIVPRTCVFTIASRNYLHFARVLMESLSVHAPDVDRVVCLCDVEEGVDEGAEDFRILPVARVDLPDSARFLFRYTVLELNTAIKPFVFRTLFEREGYDRVIYFDPDIRFYDSLRPLQMLLDAHEAVLTPHLTAPLPNDGGHPDEQAILISGTYNLGFLALRAGDCANALLRWWEGKLTRDCVVDVSRGLFVDQKWMDLAPGLFEGVHICRDEGWNVSYWNLPHRHVEQVGSSIHVNQQHLLFFHFSGVSPDGRVYSKHQDRYRMEDLQSAVHDLVVDYCAALREHGYHAVRSLPYGFGRLSDGTPIPDFLRQVFRREWEADHPDADIRIPETQQALVEYANACPEGFEWISRAARMLHTLRADLQQHFGRLPGGGEHAYAIWFVNHVQEQHPEISDLYVNPIRERLGREEQAPAGNELRSRVSARAARWAYRAAWAGRKLAYPVTTLKFRQRVNDVLLARSYRFGRRADGGDPVDVGGGPQPDARGLNLVGYLNAESGVGQAARGSIAAAEAAEIPLATHTLEVGNISRKAAHPGREDADGYPHPITLFHVNADQIPVARTELGPAVFAGRYNIGFWYWELPEFPRAWQSAFEVVDEVWVASAFCHQAVSGASPVPVVYMPPCLDLPDPPAPDREGLGLPLEPTLFLCMADGLSFLERKNPMGAIVAYQRAFPRPTGQTGLVVKLINSRYDAGLRDAIHDAVARDPFIHLIDRYLSRQELHCLFASTDAYVSLHRSEGFGLPIAEAMAFGKPALATAWSGNMDFMTPWNSLPIDYREVEIEEDIGPYAKGQRWADPDLDHAAELMARLVREPDWARALGARAQRDIRRRYSPDSAGRHMRQRLEWILDRGRARRVGGTHG